MPPKASIKPSLTPFQIKPASKTIIMMSMKVIFLKVNYILKNKLPLVIIATDAAENTKDKFESLTYNRTTKMIVWGNKEEMSHAVGTENSTVFGITDGKFAAVIESEIRKCCDEML